MRLGYAPPISGELHNEKWKTSNGAWIRSEVWACLAPGYPGIARKYAFYDASVDHGISEGTVAELFTVTLESEAFVNNNIRSVIEHALDNIPADSRVAAAVRLVIECYNKGIPYRETREKVVQQSADIGFFQAPANVAFVVIGLLYGEGDFKKSMIYAVNCGDDTDCTGATLGSILGIMNGVAGIPADWREYIGDEIKPICINGEKVRKMPATCAELTERILKMLPVLLYANGVAVTFTDGENEWDDNRYKFGVSGRQLLNRAPYSLDLPHSPYLSGRVDFDREPLLGAGESLDLHFRLHIASCLSAWCEVNVFTPDGITAQYDKTVSVHYTCKSGTEFTVRLTAEKPLAARNDVYVALRCDAHIMPVIVPVTIGGK